MTAKQAENRIGKLATRITKSKQDQATWQAELKALKLQLIEFRAAAKAAKAAGKTAGAKSSGKAKPARAAVAVGAGDEAE